MMVSLSIIQLKSLFSVFEIIYAIITVFCEGLQIIIDVFAFCACIVLSAEEEERGMAGPHPRPRR